MTADEVRRWREGRGWSQAQMAEHLSQAGRTINPFEVARWEEGLRRVPEWVGRALRPPPPPPPKPAPSPTVTLKLEAIGDDLIDGMRHFAGFCRMLGVDNGESHTKGFRRPWVAEITGLDPQYRYKRAFLSGQKDYSEANSIGSRGVYVYYHLEPGRVYEVNELVTWTRTRRYFCRVEHGRIVEMGREEALACVD